MVSGEEVSRSSRKMQVRSNLFSLGSATKFRALSQIYLIQLFLESSNLRFSLLSLRCTSCESRGWLLWTVLIHFLYRSLLACGHLPVHSPQR